MDTFTEQLKRKWQTNWKKNGGDINEMRSSNISRFMDYINRLIMLGSEGPLNAGKTREDEF
jgi:hypothetical protein